MIIDNKQVVELSTVEFPANCQKATISHAGQGRGFRAVTRAFAARRIEALLNGMTWQGVSAYHPLLGAGLKMRHSQGVLSSSESLQVHTL